MSSFVHDVCHFNQVVLGIKQRNITPLSMSEMAISKKCLQEEVDEFIDACKENDIVNQVDALVDLQYFAVGVMYKLGLTPSQINECMRVVHEANMQKKLGVNSKRGDGQAADAVKPEGWVPPEERIKKVIVGPRVVRGASV